VPCPRAVAVRKCASVPWPGRGYACLAQRTLVSPADPPVPYGKTRMYGSAAWLPGAVTCRLGVDGRTFAGTGEGLGDLSIWK
jgi:hypothetical protein